MILQAYSIGGQAVGVDLNVWQTAELNGNEAFIYNETVQADYINITSITNNFLFGNNADVDFKYNRDQIKKIVIDQGLANIEEQASDPNALTPQVGQAWQIENGVGIWLGKDGQIAIWDGVDWNYKVGDGNASAIEEFGFTFIQSVDEQQICASQLIGTVAQQLAAYSYDKAAKSYAQLQYKDQVQECRFLRYKYIENDFLQEIPQYAAICLQEIGQLGHYYYEQGIDGEAFGDEGLTGLGDWVTGYGAFQGAGLINKPWVSIFGKNMVTYSSEIANKLFIKGLNKAQQSLI